MAHKNYLFTSESVSEGHPDKVCDQISDAVLDAFLENDVKLGIADDSLVNTRLGCETLTTTNKIVIAGEGRGQAPLFTKFGDHAVINRDGDYYTVTDLGSTNGTLLNEALLPPRSPQRLRPGDRIKIGEVEMEFRGS